MKDIKELRIGNYLWYECTTHIVKSIDTILIGSWWVKDGKPVIEKIARDMGGVMVDNPYMDSIDHYDPIDLTEEWLIKLGFEEIPYAFESKRFYTFKHDNSEYWTLAHNGTNAHITTFKYVHQLQNLHHSLTGEELEIKKL